MSRPPEVPRLNYRALEGTNTKTRRLAYLTAILKMVKSDAVGERSLLIRLTRWSQQHRKELQSYWVQTGEVSSTRRNSAGARYLHLATQLGLIVSVAGAYRVTRRGRVLLALLEPHPINANPFFLNPAERLYYTHLLLERDADAFLTVTDRLLNQPGVSLAWLQKTFQADFLYRLGQKIASSSDEKLRQELLQRQVEVRGWTKPERYAEHLVPPRLNWLLDLGFLDPDRFKIHHYELTAAGKQFLTTLLHPSDDGFSDVTDEWLSSAFWEVAVEKLLDLHSLLEWDAVDEASLQNVLGDLLRDTFQVFRHTFVPKVAFTQALAYMSCRLILEHRIRVSPARLRKWFASPQVLNGRRYEVRFSPRENESYLLATAV